jgi:Tfp pilus assembly protein PilE
MKNNKGISLLELIIVVAVMAVLVGVLTPMFVKQVNKSRRSKDLVTAERISTATYLALATNSDAFDAWEKWNKLKETVSVTVDGKTESYSVYLVVSNESNPYNCFHGTVKEFGKSDGSTGFYGSLNSELGVSTKAHNSSLVPSYKVKKSGKIPGRDKNFSYVDTWRICKRVDNGQLEIWSADHNKYGGLPCFRVWPNPDDVYTK